MDAFVDLKCKLWNVMIKILLYILILINCIFANIFQHNGKLDSIQIDLVQQKYQNAKNSLAGYLQKNPSDVEALYLSLAVYQTEILDYESYHINSKIFLKTADNIKNILEKKLSTLSGKDSVMCLFYLANVYGGMSVMHAKTNNWIDGAKNGMMSVSLLKQVQKVFPDFFAAYLGIGVFNYYFSSSLKWLPFASGRCEEGLSYVEIALKSEFPFNYAAKNTLCWILIERKEYKRADSIATSVLCDYPKNSIFLRIKALVNLRSGNYQDAIKQAKLLLSLTQERSPLNWSDLVAAYFILAESYCQSGMINELRNTANCALDIAIPKEYLSVSHIKKNLKYIKDLKEKYCDK